MRRFTRFPSATLVRPVLGGHRGVNDNGGGTGEAEPREGAEQRPAACLTAARWSGPRLLAASSMSKITPGAPGFQRLVSEVSARHPAGSGGGPVSPDGFAAHGQNRTGGVTSIGPVSATPP